MMRFLPLLLCLLASVRSTSVRPALTRVRIIEVEDDYDYDEDKSRTTPSPHGQRATTSHIIHQPCDYDPCVAQTTPCDEISARTGCLCPGLTGPQERPDRPELRELKPGRPGEALVLWCAPRSTVTYYEVTVNDENIKQTFGESLRSGAVPGLRVGETVCVAAGNEAGLSERSCARFEPPPAGQAALNVGLIAGAVGVLLLMIIITLVLWRRRTCRKDGTGDSEGLGNPSYTNDGAL